MIVIDSSVWVDYFRDDASKGHRAFLQQINRNKDIAILPVILTEVLMGFRDDKDFRAASDILSGVPQLPMTSATYVGAAALFRILKKKGVTVRGAIDCLIAQTCLETSAELLTLDRDFSKIASHTQLKLVPL